MPPFARFGGNKNNKTLDILLQENIYFTFALIHIMLASTVNSFSVIFKVTLRPFKLGLCVGGEVLHMPMQN